MLCAISQPTKTRAPATPRLNTTQNQRAKLAQALAQPVYGVPHFTQPAAESVTQATERGTVYGPDEIVAIATSEVMIVKMFGVGLALAVLIDAFLVRATLVPALMRLAGRANWWAPRPLRRLHDRFGLSQSGPAPAPTPAPAPVPEPEGAR